MASHVAKPSAVLLGVFAILMATGCGGGGAANAKLRVFQGIASVTNVNILLDGAPVSGNLQYQANTGYLSVRSGSRQLAAVPAGETINQPGVIHGKVDLGANSQNTFILYGWGISVGGFSLTDDTSPAGNSGSKLRIMDAASSNTGVDVYVLAPGTTLNGNANVSFNSMPDASSYLSLAAGTYDVYFTVSAASCPIASRPCPINILFHTTITLGSGQNRTLVFLNNCNPNTCDFSTYTSLALADLN
jgi:hypothetical protein